MNFVTIQLEFELKTAMITLSRPEKRNAINYVLIEELLAALGEVARSPALVLILTGAGRAFCSGMDLENLKSAAGGSVEQSAKDSETMARFFRSLYEFPKPTIAAVNGAAIAGGCGLATLCDFTLAVSEATFGFTEVRIGFVPAIVSTFLLRQVGEKHARDLLLTGRIVSADEAYRIGLISEIVAPRGLMGRARELAAQLTENSPASQIHPKRLLSEYAREELNSRLHSAVLENAAIRASDDFREGVSSFLERRKPRWSGK
jgi:methylglutaconyl-CoA hydratase